MILLIKELKKYKFAVLIIIGALFLQAFSELSLPDYMARIVNVGIQQNGIEAAPPEVLSQKTFDRMGLVVNAADRDRLNSVYALADSAKVDEIKQRNGFAGLTGEPVMYLTNESLKTDGALTALMAKSLMTVTFLDKGRPEGIQGTIEMGNLPELPKGDQAFLMLKTMPAEAKTAF